VATSSPVSIEDTTVGIEVELQRELILVNLNA